MTSDSPKELRLLWYTVILVLVVQIAGLAYLRKKFDDNIVILQSSENYVTKKVESIELMLWKMHEADAKTKLGSMDKVIKDIDKAAQEMPEIDKAEKEKVDKSDKE
jgi:hypothetical protein